VTAKHNRIVADILRAKETQTLIKSEPMLTEECCFQEYMPRARAQAFAKQVLAIFILLPTTEACGAT
jgi:L-lactate utilization protein LutB